MHSSHAAIVLRKARLAGRGTEGGGGVAGAWKGQNASKPLFRAVHPGARYELPGRHRPEQRVGDPERLLSRILELAHDALGLHNVAVLLASADG